MRIKNVTTFVLNIPRLFMKPDGSLRDAILDPDEEILIYDELAEASEALKKVMTRGFVTKVSNEEPNDFELNADPRSADAFTLATLAFEGSEGLRHSNGIVDVSGEVLPTGPGLVLVSNGTTSAEWQSTSSTVTFVDLEAASGTKDGVNKIFTLAQVPILGSLHLFWNGLLQLPGGEDYSISTNTITMTESPNAVDKLIASYRV